MSPTQQIAAACGVTEADVMFFAQLAATRIQQGLDPAAAIEAASSTGIELCNRAYRSISQNDPTNEFGHRDQFLPTVYALLQQ